MRHLLFIISIGVWFAASAQAQPEVYRGKLVQLSADTNVRLQQVLSSAAGETVPRFDPPVAKGTTVSAGKLRDPRGDGSITVAVVEPAGGEPFIGADANGDGTIEIEERSRFSPVEGGEGYLQAGVMLPIKHPLFRSVPVEVVFYRGFEHASLKKTDRLISQTVLVNSFGKVSIGGREVLFQYPFDAANASIATKDGLFGIDVDGDGKIQSEQFSLEVSYAVNEETVFRYGDKYLSTASIDAEKNEIVVRVRDKSEYPRAELRVGAEMPDFEFVDFAGNKRTLKEFRGKYLLVEFWGVWCFDCVRDMPHSVQAYERFRPRGFEILGLNWDDNPEDAKAFLAKSGAPWTQARKDSIKRLTETVYRIHEYPSTVLLGPDGKVLVLDQKRIQGAPLLQTLESILPKR